MRMGRLKTQAPGDDDPVTMLELFFDLVFVFVVTQLTALILASDGGVGYAQALLVLLPTWWMYDGYAWLANNVSPTTVSTRLPMLIAMTGFLVMAISVPDAFGTGAWLFAVAYLVVVLLHAVSFARSSVGTSAMAIRTILPVNLTVAGLLLVGAAVGERWGWTCWTAAGVVLLIGVFTRQESGFTLRVEHFVERHQLLIIIALGETVIATGVSAQGQLTEPRVLLTVVLSMALISALWWVYFGSGDDARGVHALQSLPKERQTRMSLLAYSLGHLGHIAGLVLVAVGLHAVVHEPGHSLGWDAAIPLSAGVALFLAAEVAFRAVLQLGRVAAHATAVAGSLVIAAAGVIGTGLLQLGLLVALVVILLLVAERVGDAEPVGDAGPVGRRGQNETHAP